MTGIENIEEVAFRLKGLRDALDITAHDMAKSCGIEKDIYLDYENGVTDIPVSFLQVVARVYNVELNALLFGQEPKMSSYFVTRKGSGPSIERTMAYKYEALASGFAKRNLDPLMVIVEPKENAQFVINSHDGQEFNYIVEGRMELLIGDNSIILSAGDSIMFDAKLPHGMKALDNKKVQFIAIIS